MSSLPKPSFLHVKLTGGATAQCLGLMNAIYASSKLNIPFKVSYYPYATGTYWPFAIKDLLNENEIINLNVSTTGLSKVDNLEVGKIITNHPLMKKKISYEGALSLMRKLKLEGGLQFLRRELAIFASPIRLMRISNYYSTISGGYAAINEIEVNQEMHRRFLKAKMKSPFLKNPNEEPNIVIHYRLGDKKSAGNHPSDFNADHILDPKSYADTINQLSDLNIKNIYVVSDDPKLAQELLSEVNVSAKIKPSTGDIWQDLYFMAQADIFIGSKSQVSQLANICVESNGGKSFMFNVINSLDYQKFKNTTYLQSHFLKLDHKVYSLDFKLETNAHSAYKSK